MTDTDLNEGFKPIKQAMLAADRCETELLINNIINGSSVVKTKICNFVYFATSIDGDEDEFSVNPIAMTSVSQNPIAMTIDWDNINSFFSAAFTQEYLCYNKYLSGFVEFNFLFEEDHKLKPEYGAFQGMYREFDDRLADQSMQWATGECEKGAEGFELPVHEFYDSNIVVSGNGEIMSLVGSEDSSAEEL